MQSVLTKAWEAAKHHQGKLMLVGAVAVATNAILHLIDVKRKTSSYILNPLTIDIRGYLNESSAPWALIVFADGDRQRLQEITKLLVYNQVNVAVIAHQAHEEAIDEIHQQVVKAKRAFRHISHIYGEYDQPASWEGLHEEFADIDLRLVYILNDRNRMAWRCYEENNTKSRELAAIASNRYILPLLLLSIAKLEKKGKRLIVSIDGNADPVLDEASHVLFNGVGSELADSGVDYRRCVNLNTYINL